MRREGEGEGWRDRGRGQANGVDAMAHRLSQSRVRVLGARPQSGGLHPMSVEAAQGECPAIQLGKASLR